jgi:3-oxoacyl-[acyl-carrier protein] reductase
MGNARYYNYRGFYRERPVSGPYEPVAASKYAGELALRTRKAEFEEKGITFLVVSGDMIEGTITPRLLERMNEGVIESRRRQVGSRPTVEEFARAIADAAFSGEKNGATIFVGSTK